MNKLEKIYSSTDNSLMCTYKYREFFITITRHKFGDDLSDSWKGVIREDQPESTKSDGTPLTGKNWVDYYSEAGYDFKDFPSSGDVQIFITKLKQIVDKSIELYSDDLKQHINITKDTNDLFDSLQ